MKRKYKVLLKLNFLSIFLIAVSFISITLAWFAYSGLARAETDINVKAWYIEFQKNGEAVGNDITISLDDIYPGMEPKLESIDIKNLGDSDATISYSITGARILDEQLDVTNQRFIEDKLSHEYPFHLNIGLSKNYAVKEDGTSELKVSISWPLDSGNDEEDSTWGKEAYNFKKGEEERVVADTNYQARPPLKITISLKAEQSLDSNESLDLRYTLGDIVLYNPTQNVKCDKVSSTCLTTHIIDIENKVGDTEVTLLPDLFKSYGLTSYNSMDSVFTGLKYKAEFSKSSVEDLLKVLSTDIENSYYTRENLSDVLLGYMKYDGRALRTLEEASINEGSFTYSNTAFPYLTSSRCFWLKESYDDERAFALSKIDDAKSVIGPLDKTTKCSILPIFKIPKSNLS